MYHGAVKGRIDTDFPFYAAAVSAVFVQLQITGIHKNLQQRMLKIERFTNLTSINQSPQLWNFWVGVRPSVASGLCFGSMIKQPYRSDKKSEAEKR